jgi:hypothetical protein
MRSGLLSDLAVIGYEIFLDGDNIHYRFAGKQIPDNAQPLLHELKTHKAEVINILKAGNTITHTEKTQPRENMKALWSPEVQAFINWFMKLETPAEPFYLEPHRKVINPEKFFVSLRNEISIGPSCPRNRTGALLCDLKILRKILH